MNILITGGAGYIGTHTLVELHQAGYKFIVYDNFSNSTKESIKRVENIINITIECVNGDVRDENALDKVFTSKSIDAVVHFAGLKAVGDSVLNPIDYYDNNINGTLVLLSVMKKHNCKKFIFSSSATVYNEVKNNKNYIPLSEESSVGEITSPYGKTKYFVEELLKDIYISDNEYKIVILRYFNPVGAHESGKIGEDPTGIPNNLMPFIAQTAVGKREILNVFGGDYDTHDGTGVRDYIHVVDLARGHVKAIDYIRDRKIMEKPLIVNLGTGKGSSVLDLIKAFECASGKKVKYRIVERRAGDTAICFANPSYAKDILGWQTEKNIDEMCYDSWKWQSKNPNGYKIEEKLN